jgi:hypothetical protein
MYVNISTYTEVQNVPHGHFDGFARSPIVLGMEPALQITWNGKPGRQRHGSAWGPVILPVFKTGGRQVFLSPVGSTPTRFRQVSQ